MRTQRMRAVVLPVGAWVVAACAHGGRQRAPEGGGAAGAAPARNPNAATQEDLQTQPVRRVEELFAGRFPGVQVNQVAGGITVRVRGASSLTGNDEPLYVIDGQIIRPGPGGLIGLNPADIARIEVLKSGADLAEYGSRGGNGVVKITTKRPGR